MRCTFAPIVASRSWNTSKSISMRVAAGIDAEVRHASHRHAPEPHRARNVESADVLGGVGDQLDHRAAPHPLDEEQPRREDDDDANDDEKAQPRVTLLGGHHQTP